MSFDSLVDSPSTPLLASLPAFIRAPALPSVRSISSVDFRTDGKAGARMKTTAITERQP